MRRFIIYNLNKLFSFEYIGKKHTLLENYTDKNQIIDKVSLSSTLKNMGRNYIFFDIEQEKALHRQFSIGNVLVELITIDDNNCQDINLLIKSEIVLRKLKEYFTNINASSTIYALKEKFSSKKISDFEAMFDNIIFEKNTDNLINIVNNLENPHQDLESVINKFLNVIPSNKLEIDPLIIFVDKSRIIISADLTEKKREMIIDEMESIITPILGKIYFNNLIDKHLNTIKK